MKKIRKGDQVVVTTGKDKGKRGTVLKVLDTGKVVVEGVNRVKRHTRPGPMSQGGIEEKEAPIHVSNVAHIDPNDKKATRVGFKVEGERKVRISRRSGVAIDQ